MKISIITVTLNNKAGLLRAIESVSSQTYKIVEHIIVDGLSTDGTAEILKQVQNDGNDGTSSRADVRDIKDSERFLAPAGIRNDKSLITNHYTLVSISEKDNGIYEAINKGIKLATGDVIGLLHSDDFYADEFVLEKYAEAFLQCAKRQALSEVEAVFSDLVYVKDKAKGENHSLPYILYPIPYSTIRYWRAQNSHFTTEAHSSSSLRKNKWIKKGWMPPHPTLFVRREVFEKYGLYRTDMKIAADYEMILRLFYKHKITSHYLPITTYCMTIGGASNKSIGNIITKSCEDYLSMKMHELPFPFFTLISKNFRKLPQFLFHKN